MSKTEYQKYQNFHGITLAIGSLRKSSIRCGPWTWESMCIGTFCPRAELRSNPTHVISAPCMPKVKGCRLQVSAVIGVDFVSERSDGVIDTPFNDRRPSVSHKHRALFECGWRGCFQGCRCSHHLTDLNALMMFRLTGLPLAQQCRNPSLE